MPTPDELAQELRDLADEVAALDDPPAPVEPTPVDPTPADPTPPPAATAPAKPTGLACVIGADGRPQLSWDAAADATAWEVHDLANLAKTLQATVTEPRTTRSALKAGQHRRYAVLAVGPGGRSEMSDPIDVPPAGGQTPTPVPSSGGAASIDLSRWYLTLPTGKQGSPDTIHQPALASYGSKYFERTADGIIFRVWHGGVTTSGSPNPRSELRECNADGSLAKWSAAKGVHTMTVTGQVNRLTKVRPHVVLWQVHGASDDVCTFRLEGTSLYITDGDNTHGHLVTDAFNLGERYELKGQVTPGPKDGDPGQIRFWFNGQPVDYTLTSKDAGCYYKAGCYAQTNPKSAPTESTSEWDEVVVYSVNVTHSA